MASRNVKNPSSASGHGTSYESVGKLPSNTLKRHPKMDLNKNDMLRLLSYLEGELQARDVVIATMKAEKARQVLYQAKYGRVGLADPFYALQRDSDDMKDNAFDEQAVKALYDNQLAQLENLISTQRNAQIKMREQLVFVEKKYHKVLSELEDEKRKHAQDTAQGDDVTYMLEKERERLRNEIEFEKNQSKKAKKELDKVNAALEQEVAMSQKHKQVALMLIKERKDLVEKFLLEKQKFNFVQKSFQDGRNKVKIMAEGLEQESKKSLKMEAELEKKLHEFDMEREQLKAKLTREENKNKDLHAEIERLRQQVESIKLNVGDQPLSPRESTSPQTIEIKSSVAQKPLPAEKSPHLVATTPVKVQKVVGKVPSASDNSIASSGKNHLTGGQQLPPKATSNADPVVKKTIMQLANSNADGANTVPKNEIKNSGGNSASAGNRVNLNSANATTGGNTAVFTTPSGGKISLSVGQRKVSPLGRGAPPPIPPNKPVLTPAGGKKEVGNKGAVSPRSSGIGSVSDSSTSGGTSPEIKPTKPAPPSKFGVILMNNRDRTAADRSSSSPESPNANLRPITISNVSSASNAATSSSSNTTVPVKRATQQLPSDPNRPMSSSDNNLDFLGQEMADLQELLVSMATGESGPSSLEDQSLASPSLSSTTSSTNSSNAMSSTSSFTSSVLASQDGPSAQVLQLSYQGNSSELQKVLTENGLDLTAEVDGKNALHLAVECGHFECLKLLLEHGANPNTSGKTDGLTPLHAAAKLGQYGCLKLLLDHHAKINCLDHQGWTPLVWSAYSGHTDICKLLLDSGARLDIKTSEGWTCAHAATQAGHTECIELLLTYRQGSQFRSSPKPTSQSAPLAELYDIVNVADVEGRTIAHMAAIKETKDCLTVMTTHCDLDLDCRDKNGRTVYDVASKACKELLESLGPKNDKMCTVCIDIERNPNHIHNEPLHYTVGVIKVMADTSWPTLEEKLGDVLSHHFKTLATGLKTKKTTRLEHDSPSPDSGPYTLALSMDSVKSYSIGQHSWSPGTPSTKSPFEILCNNETKKISIELFGCEDGCQDALSYETLIPATTLQNYLRLIEQYKNVVFYGPVGSSKTYLARTLAYCIQVRERNCGHSTEISFLAFTPAMKKADLYHFLMTTGGLLPAETAPPSKKSPILILDDLSKINISDIFGDLLPALEQRGPKNSVGLKLDNKPLGSFYLTENCYIIGTMDRTRCASLDLTVQQRFRWVNCRIDTEPVRGLLSRQLYRRLISKYGGRLPPSDDPVYRAVEWVICVWQRLNDGLGKLGLPELVFGPSHFLVCPIEVNQPKNILRWLSLLWNHTIAPAVSEAVVRGSGAADVTSEGQQKVVNTALYVLMQRSVVTGCPLSGQEKERYLSSFHGSNELDIQMRERGRHRGHREMSPVLTPDLSPDDATASPLKQFEVAKTHEDLVLSSKRPISSFHEGRSSSFSSPSSSSSAFSSSALGKAAPPSSINVPTSRSETELNYMQKKMRRHEISSDGKSGSPRCGMAVPVRKYDLNVGGAGGGRSSPVRSRSPPDPMIHIGAAQSLSLLTDDANLSSFDNKNGTQSVTEPRAQSMTQRLREDYFRDMMTPARTEKSPSPEIQKVQ
ncbi:cortactin-binding protein 2 isoform X1 [Lingula anatina]|uniref:Cortactin-binding protein 2 n=1 Tax=Lingula anatina TaxID=7574 RepID=A0A1S3K4L2_LINAN|nr:cortactin-binding protein 2 isoform X1 [Lingula anatina]|eukprot:XP_013417462.1 cortactin-binding protein 2 isoform X1 [Lingula anatina]